MFPKTARSLQNTAIHIITCISVRNRSKWKFSTQLRNSESCGIVLISECLWYPGRQFFFFFKLEAIDTHRNGSQDFQHFNRNCQGLNLGQSVWMMTCGRFVLGLPHFTYRSSHPSSTRQYCQWCHEEHQHTREYTRAIICDSEMGFRLTCKCHCSCDENIVHAGAVTCCVGGRACGETCRETLISSYSTRLT